MSRGRWRRTSGSWSAARTRRRRATLRSVAGRIERVERQPGGGAPLAPQDPAPETLGIGRPQVGGRGRRPRPMPPARARPRAVPGPSRRSRRTPAARRCPRTSAGSRVRSTVARGPTPVEGGEHRAPRPVVALLGDGSQVVPGASRPRPMAPACSTGPPTKTTPGAAASSSQPGSDSPRSTSVGRLITTPRAPASRGRAGTPPSGGSWGRR